MKIVTLSFDDGFADSFPRVADIYERHGLKSSLNVIATGHLPSFKSPDIWHEGFPKAGFDVWNALAARGHEVMPHGLKHANKQALPFKKAQGMIRKCLSIFHKNLKGYSDRKAIFNFPYNRSTPELETWLAKTVLAFRTGGPALNPLPHPRTFKITNTADGPGNCERSLDALLKPFLKRREGWFVYNLHGLDKEGWGPVRAIYLDKLLKKLKAVKNLKVWTAGQALEWGRR